MVLQLTRNSDLLTLSVEEPVDSSLAAWLQSQLRERHVTIETVAATAHVGEATISDILHKGHIPKIETLFRLADYFGTSHLDILFISGHLQRGDQLPGAPKPGQPPPDESNMEWQLIQEFRRVPADLRQDALDAIHMLTRAAKRPAYRIIGEDEHEGEEDHE